MSPQRTRFEDALLADLRVARDALRTVLRKSYRESLRDVAAEAYGYYEEKGVIAELEVAQKGLQELARELSSWR